MRSAGSGGRDNAGRMSRCCDARRVCSASAAAVSPSAGTAWADRGGEAERAAIPTQSVRTYAPTKNHQRRPTATRRRTMRTRTRMPGRPEGKCLKQTEPPPRRRHAGMDDPSPRARPTKARLFGQEGQTRDPPFFGHTEKRLCPSPRPMRVRHRTTAAPRARFATAAAAPLLLCRLCNGIWGQSLRWILRVCPGIGGSALESYVRHVRSLGVFSLALFPWEWKAAAAAREGMCVWFAGGVEWNGAVLFGEGKAPGGGYWQCFFFLLFSPLPSLLGVPAGVDVVMACRHLRGA